MLKHRFEGMRGYFSTLATWFQKYIPENRRDNHSGIDFLFFRMMIEMSPGNHKPTNYKSYFQTYSYLNAKFKLCLPIRKTIHAESSYSIQRWPLRAFSLCHALCW